MAGGADGAGPGVGQVHGGRLTSYVITAALIAASGGLFFGYDLGVAGGVTTQPAFLATFFPSVLDARSSSSAQSSAAMWCKFNSHLLQLVTSCHWLAGLAGAAMASWTTSGLGRVATMRMAGLLFLTAAVMASAATSTGVLVTSRLILGFGLGLSNQAVPLYLSEIAPAQWRGALNQMFSLGTTVGIFTGQLVNYWSEFITPWGWRLALGLAALPALVLLGGSLGLPDTPSSLVERGHAAEGKAVLQRLRGKEYNVDDEFDGIVKACNRASTLSSFTTILDKKYRAELAWAMLLPFFQQMTGVNSLVFYGPILFASLGFGTQAALYSACVIGSINVMATVLSIASVDRFGRKVLFLSGGILMFFMQLDIAVILAMAFPGDSAPGNPKDVAAALVTVIGIFVLGFAVSWGPLAWLVPSEIQPLETRSAGQSITVATNFVSSFAVAQGFLPMLCSMRWGIFLFFAAWLVLMTFIVEAFLPETNGIPIEDIANLWNPMSLDEGAATIFSGPSSTEVVEMQCMRRTSRGQIVE